MRILTQFFQMTIVVNMKLMKMIMKKILKNSLSDNQDQNKNSSVIETLGQ